MYKYGCISGSFVKTHSQMCTTDGSLSTLTATQSTTNSNSEIPDKVKIKIIRLCSTGEHLKIKKVQITLGTGIFASFEMG